MDNSFKETIDYKAKKIVKAMDAKEKSMAIMAAGRDATLIVTALMPNYIEGAKILKQSGKEVDEILKGTIKDWRNWFYYNIYTLDPDEQLEQEAKEKGEIDPF